VDNSTSEATNSMLFSIGRSSDYEGLHPPKFISEDILGHSRTAREIRREDVYEQPVADNDLFDWDLGDSLDNE